MNRAAPLVGDGGDGGDSGIATQPDAGLCSDDSQCGSGFYCNFTVTDCPFDAGNVPFATVNNGSCLPAGGLSSTGACQTGDDCPESELCFGSPPWGGPPSDEFYCTRDAPCDAGLCGNIPGPMEPHCPVGCTAVAVPHTRDYFCVCDGNACPAYVPPEGNCADGGGIVCTYFTSPTTTVPLCVCCPDFGCWEVCGMGCQAGDIICASDAGACATLYCTDPAFDSNNCGGCGITCDVDAGQSCRPRDVWGNGVCTDGG